MAISAHDRKRLWGKSGGRCALCRRLLTHPGSTSKQEAVIGEEAHIEGARPGAARYTPLPYAERDAYEKRILLCPDDHAIVDAQPDHWTVQRLRAAKSSHEQSMRARTADARSDGLRFHMPPAVMLDAVIGGKQLLDIVGPVDAYVFDHDELETDAEHDAAEALLDAAHGWGEVYDALSPAERIGASRDLGKQFSQAMGAGLLLMGNRIQVDVTYFGARDRWPVATLRLRRATVVAAEQAAAVEIERALDEGGIEGLEAWAEAAKRRHET